MLRSRFSYALLIPLCATLVLLSSYALSETKAQHGSSFSYVGVPGATRVGAGTCATCHSDESQDFKSTFHARQGEQCEDCHGAGSLHANGGDTSKIVSFGLRPAKEANDACLNCHAQSEHQRNWNAGAHAANGVRCTDCHQVHAKARQADATAAYRLGFTSMHAGNSTKSDDLLTEDIRSTESLEASNENCVRCHQSERGQMALPSHHPLQEGKMGCIDCHDAHGGPSGNNLKTANDRELCTSCHAEYRGPFAYQHRPAQETCLGGCHTPHGSTNSNLLTLSEPGLCVQCHNAHEGAYPSPAAFARCTTCHGSVMGAEEESNSGVPAFLDDSNVNLPTQPVQGSVAAIANATQPIRKITATALPGAGAGLAGIGTLIGLIGNAPAVGTNMGPDHPETSAWDSASSYRFLDVTGSPLRAGQYDSLKEALGAQAENTTMYNTGDVSLKSRASVISSDDYRLNMEFNAAHRIQAGVDARSSVQQQNAYNFTVQGILVNNYIPSGSVFGVERRLGTAYAKADLPSKVPVQLFVRGNWQARVGSEELNYLDQGGIPYPYCAAGACHHVSQFTAINNTTRGVSGGAQVKVGSAAITYEHGFNSFNDRLPFSSGAYIPAYGNIMPLGTGAPVNNYVRITPPTQVSSDTARLSWLLMQHLTLNGETTYARSEDMYLKDKQNAVIANAAIVWNPTARMGVIGELREDSLIANFVPPGVPLYLMEGLGVGYSVLYPNITEPPTSHHNLVEDARVNYVLTNHFNVDLDYGHSDITRSNSDTWCMSNRYCSYGAGAAETVTNSGGLSLMFRSSQLRNRLGYEYIHTGRNDIAYNTDFGSNNRVFMNTSFSPAHLFNLTNDFQTRIQNAYPYPTSIVFQHVIPSWISDLPAGVSKKINDHFYSETLAVSRPLQKTANISVGYSYQQTKKLMPVDWIYDYGYGEDETYEQASTPYNQLSQSFFGGTSWALKSFGIDARVDFNNAHSRIYPDTSAADGLALGNQRLVNINGLCPSPYGGNSGAPGNPVNCYDAIVFAKTTAYMASVIQPVSEVRIPQWMGEGRAYYVLPRNLKMGMLFNYGSYNDYWNSTGNTNNALLYNENGDVRAFNLFVGRTW